MVFPCVSLLLEDMRTPSWCILSCGEGKGAEQPLHNMVARPLLPGSFWLLTLSWSPLSKSSCFLYCVSILVSCGWLLGFRLLQLTAQCLGSGTGHFINELCWIPGCMIQVPVCQWLPKISPKPKQPGVGCFPTVSGFIQLCAASGSLSL